MFINNIIIDFLFIFSNEALAEYLNYKNSLTKNLTADFVITDEEGNQFTIEQVRAKSIMSDKKIKKPGE